MASSIVNLQILGQSSAAKELDLASEIFHRINRVIPVGQTLFTVPPNCPVRDAVARMLKYGYSQVPVVQDGEVLGVFSFRSFAEEVANPTLEESKKQKCAPGDLPVDAFLEQFEFARVTEDLSRRVFDALYQDNGILIGTSERLIGIVTPKDFVRYYNQVASPFVMVSEIELALRALIMNALDADQVVSAAKRCLASVYGGEDRVPTSLEEMTFDNYKTIITNKEIWPKFEPIFRGTRTWVYGKLRQIGDIRNDLFHFKREITEQDCQTLATRRTWLQSKIKQAEAPTTVMEAQS
jgi:predicted transcriptional regulator